MSTHSHPAVTRSECVLCGGPCKEPFDLPAIHDRYPFLTPAQIAGSQLLANPPVDQPPAPRRARRKRTEAR